MPYVEDEVADIMKVWKGKAYMNEEANLEKLKSREQNFQIVHIATGGQESSIGLWGALLTSSQFRQIDWDSPPVELLVLSSCDTGLGEGYGLAGSAIKSGVKSVLGSIHLIPDRQTAFLMNEFYRNLKNAPIKAEALRQAQISMIKGRTQISETSMQKQKGVFTITPEPGEEVEGFSHPFNWAGFTMIGSPW